MFPGASQQVEFKNTRGKKIGEKVDVESVLQKNDIDIKFPFRFFRHSNGHNLGSSGRFSVFFRAAWVMEWGMKSYTRSHWLPGTKYGTNKRMAHGHLLHAAPAGVAASWAARGGGVISVERLGFDRSDQQKWNPL
jgi:hypothetical protein